MTDFEKFSNKKSLSDLSGEELKELQGILNKIDNPVSDVKKLKESLSTENIDKVYKLEISFVDLRKNIQEVEIRNTNLINLKKNKTNNLKELFNKAKNNDLGDYDLKDVEFDNLDKQKFLKNLEDNAKDKKDYNKLIKKNKDYDNKINAENLKLKSNKEILKL